MIKKTRLTRDYFIDCVAKEVKDKTCWKVLKKDIKVIINRFLYDINHILIERKKITFRCFGTFRIITLKSRIRQDVVRGKSIRVPKQLDIKFKASKSVLKLLREN